MIDRVPRTGLLAGVFLLAVAARVGWTIVVPPNGDSLEYWNWAAAILDGRSFGHAAHWTASYPWILIVLSAAERLSLTATSVVQAALQAALVFPVARVLERVGFRRGAVAAGALAIAVGPFSSFAGSRMLSDPLASLFWWIGIALALDWVLAPSPRWADWMRLASAAAALGLAAHLRLNMIPAVGVSAAAVLLGPLVLRSGVHRTVAAAALIGVACLPAVLAATTARAAVDAYNKNTQPFRAWMSTFYLGYDRWNEVDQNPPWDGKDPRPFLPPGWRERNDGPRADAVIGAALSGAPEDWVRTSFSELGLTWKREHPIRYNLILPLERIVGAWVPLAPEIWVRPTPYRILQYGERCITFLGLAVLCFCAIRWADPRVRYCGAVVLVCAVAVPTLTVIATHLTGTEFSDYRVHHAGWIPALAAGAAWLYGLASTRRLTGAWGVSASREMPDDAA